MWAYNNNLGYNMWFDKYSLLNFNEYDKIERDFLYFEREVWDRIIEFLPAQGINTVVIDLAEGIKYDSCPEIAVKGSLEKAEFKKMLEKCGINVTIRREMGRDIDGACGQLRKRYTETDKL